MARRGTSSPGGTPTAGSRGGAIHADPTLEPGDPSLDVAVVLQLAVVEVPFLQQAFGTSSLDVAHLAVAVALASVVLWVEEGAKLVRRLAG